MRVLIVAPYPLGQAASQRFRFEQYLPLLQQKGIAYTFASFWSPKSWAVLFIKGYTWQKVWGMATGFMGRLLLLPTLHQYDYVFIHREATPVGPPWLEWWVAKVTRRKIIYDFDDAIWLPYTSDANAAAARLKNHGKTASICRWSHKVSCGNSYLEAYARQFNSNTVLLPTTIDTVHHHNKQKQHGEEPLTIGWTGSHSTLPYLKLLEPVLQRLQEQYTFTFLVIADQAPAALHLQRLKFLPWKKETEVADLLQFDIGVMPLPDTEWAKGKCGFKALQYMALGIPVVASAVGVNPEVVPQGQAGYTCKTPQEWYSALEKLLLQVELRRGMGEAGRLRVERHYSTQAQQQRFLALFS